MTTEHTDTADGVGERLRGPLQRFRVAAVLTGIGLLGMVVVMIIRYGFDNAGPSTVYSPIHGVLYMFYVALAVDLGIRARWSIKGIVLVLLAGCIPLISFFAERTVTQRVAAGRAL